MESTIEAIQTVFFLKDFLIKDDYEKSKVLIYLKENLGNIFDNELVSIPIPNDAPPEFPRFVMNSKNQWFSCDISLNKVNVLFNVISDIEKKQNELNDLPENQKKISIGIFNFIKELENIIGKKVIINRIGFITKLHYEHDKGINFLRTEFINEKKLKDPKELLIRYNQINKLPELDNIEMNSLITISNKADKEKIVNMQADINTSAKLMPEIDFCIADKAIGVLDFCIKKTKEFIKDFPEI